MYRILTGVSESKPQWYQITKTSNHYESGVGTFRAFEVPKQIHFVEGIPRGVLGKVSRASVREAMANIESMQMVEHVQTHNPNSRPADTVLEPLVAVTERVGLAPLSSRLASIRTWLSDDLAHLERAIRDGADAAELGESDVEEHLAVQTARYLLGRPGKRIRPLCVMLGARMGGRELDREVKDLAVACRTHSCRHAAAR